MRSRITERFSLVTLAAALLAVAQPTNQPAFEVASIRPSQNCVSDRAAGPPSPGRVNLCATLANHIKAAYVLFADGSMSLSREADRVPLEGGPNWIRTDRYQISAKAEGSPREEVMRGPMLQTLLQDRFKLKLRREVREVPAYALTVAKGGPKLSSSDPGSCTPFTALPPPPRETKVCGPGFVSANGSSVTMQIQGYDLDEVSAWLFGITGRPVINKTGLSGKFDFRLEFTPDQSTPGMLARFQHLRGSPGENPIPGADPPGGTSLFTALQADLGLKLESAKGPQEFLIVESVEKPSEN